MKTKTHQVSFTLINPPIIGVCAGCLHRKALTIEAIHPMKYHYCPACEHKRPEITKLVAW